MRRLAEKALAQPRTTVALAALSALVAALLALRGGLSVDNGIPVWLPRGDPELARYDAFRRLFGEDGFAAVLVPDGARVGALRDELERVEGVAEVRGPLRGEGAGAAGAALLLAVPEGDAESARRLVPRVEAALAASPDGAGTAVAGPAAINHALDVESRHSFSRLFPAVLALSAGVLGVVLRDARCVLGILAVAAVATSWVLAAITLAGLSMNMVVAPLPALLLVLSTAYALHVLAAFQRGPSGDPEAAWRSAIASTLRPCAWTAATTAVGLGALATAEIPPIRHLGLLGAAGVLASFALVFLFLPAALALLGARPRPGTAREQGAAAERVARAVVRARPAVLAGAALAAVVAGFGLARLRVESDVLAYFPADHALVQGTRAIEERVLGLTPIDVWVDAPADSALSPGTVALAGRLEAALADEPAVSGVLGPLAGPGAPPPGTPPVGLALAAGAWPGRVVNDGARTHLRWTIATRTTSIEASEALLRRVAALLDQLSAGEPDLVLRATGAVPLLLRVQTLLLRAQVRTFGVSLLLVTALLALCLRSPRLALVGLVPNLLPIALVLGGMGFVGLPLDVATVTVASLALGLVVDDTIHVLHRWTAAGGRGGEERLAATLRACLRPVLATSMALAVGFAAFAVSPFRPTRDFGLLVAATALCALACTLLVLPALLLERPGRAPRPATATAP